MRACASLQIGQRYAIIGPARERVMRIFSVLVETAALFAPAAPAAAASRADWDAGRRGWGFGTKGGRGMLRILLCYLLLSGVLAMSAAAENAPGVTDSEIKIGQTMPY